MWLHSLKVAQLLRSAACLHTNQSRSYLNHLVLRIIQLYKNMVRRGSNSILNHSNIIYRICPTMRTNIILRCNCNYKPIISNSIYRKRKCSMNMRGICSRQRYPHTILCTTLSNTICNCSNSIDSSSIPSPNRIK